MAFSITGKYKTPDNQQDDIMVKWMPLFLGFAYATYKQLSVENRGFCECEEKSCWAFEKPEAAWQELKDLCLFKHIDLMIVDKFRSFLLYS